MFPDDLVYVALMVALMEMMEIIIAMNPLSELW